jgi:2-keto-4-pentenoate hydratase/2-oxohepta-3-ene-1,7-dioic acid hydratase in catechol pathway
MKICRFLVEKGSNPLNGVLIEEKVFVLKTENVFSDDLKASEKHFALEEVTLLPPVLPSKIVCVGRNYAEHAAELGNEIPKEPLLFLKAPSSLIINRESIILPAQSERVEHEGELAVVIGRTAKNLVQKDDPFDYIFGYTCLNDVTARDLQKKDVQFTRAKSFDTFCPIGDFIETDLDPGNLDVIVRVNNSVKQRGNTAQMVFPVSELIRYISQNMTLLPGDIIATGTPAGVSALKEGDRVEVEIEGIGVLSNPVTK